MAFICSTSPEFDLSLEIGEGGFPHVGATSPNLGRFPPGPMTLHRRGEGGRSAAVHPGVKNHDLAKIAESLGVIEPVPHHKPVINRKPDVLHGHFDLAKLMLDRGADGIYFFNNFQRKR